MLKHQLLVKSLKELSSNMNEIAVDLKALYPDVSASSQMEDAARVVAAWVDNIENGKFYD